MRKFGIIGNPLGHSFSPGYFNEKFLNEHIDAVYEKHELKNIADLSQCYHSIQGKGDGIP